MIVSWFLELDLKIVNHRASVVPPNVVLLVLSHLIFIQNRDLRIANQYLRCIAIEKLIKKKEIFRIKFNLISF